MISGDDLKNYKCMKCGSEHAKLGEIVVSGDHGSSMFNIDNKSITSVICKECSYTEFYSCSFQKLLERYKPVS